MPLSPQIPPQPRDIEILASPGVQLLDATGPLQVFASANKLAGAGAEDAPYCVRLVAAAAPVASSAGLRLFADPLPSPRAPVDTLIVAGGRGVHAAAGPARAVKKMRVEAARQLLTESSLPVKRIAERCGFGSEETMRRSFLRQIGITPQDDRMRFAPGGGVPA
jgi:transcriptional regulator GlxA family with amidase domain